MFYPDSKLLQSTPTEGNFKGFTLQQTSVKDSQTHFVTKNVCVVKSTINGTLEQAVQFDPNEPP